MQWDSLYGDEPVLEKPPAKGFIDFDDGDFGTGVPTAPVVRVAGGGLVVPHDVRSAAETLLQWTDLPAGPEARGQLLRIAQAPDDLVAVDPLLVLRFSVDTGSCRICVCEVARASQLLLLVALRASYTLQVTPKSRAVELPFSDVTAAVHRDDVELSEAQPFGVEAALREALEGAEREDLAVQVASYMHQLGPVHPSRFCDAFEHEDHVQRIRAIATGEESALEAPRKKRFTE